MILRTPPRRAQIFGTKLDIPKNAIDVAIGGKADIRSLANKIEDTAKPNRIKIDYAAPKNPAHQMIYRKLREIRALENLREFLSLSFTNPLFLRFEGSSASFRR